MHSYKHKDNQFNVIACKEIDWDNPRNCDVHFSVYKDCKYCQNANKEFRETIDQHILSLYADAQYNCKCSDKVLAWAKQLEKQGLAHKSYTDGCPFKKELE